MTWKGKISSLHEGAGTMAACRWEDRTVILLASETAPV